MWAPAQIMQRLEDIDRDLAVRAPELEEAAQGWFTAKRDKEQARAAAFLKAEGTVAERTAQAEAATGLVGVEHEAKYEAMKAVTRVLETRATIGQALLKAHGRAGS